MRHPGQHTRSQKIALWFTPVVVAFCFSVLLIKTGIVPSYPKVKPQGRIFSALSKQDQLQQDQIIDSIVAVIQSYYVDGERVNNAKLLDGTVDALALEPGVNVRREGDDFVVDVDGDEQRYHISKDMDYSDFLQNLSRITTQLSHRESKIASLDKSTDSLLPNAQAMFKAMLSSLDAHSSLLDTEAYRELRQGTEGSFGGLGVLVGIRDQLLTVIKPMPRSPAQKAGVKRRDRIVGINGLDTYGYTLDQLVEHMRGEPGTRVSLTLLRENDLAPQQVSLQREIINVDSVTSRQIRRGSHTVLWVGIETFSSRTSQEVLAAIKRARTDSQGQLGGVVLDLRSNPGGLLDQAVQVADLFLKNGVIVTTRGRRNEVESADRGYNEIDYPMVILMNGDSASASEIVAGALQDHGRAVIVGQPSFGKGSVQTIFELPGEQALKLTIARYYTPLGRSIQNVGIMPDVLIQPVYTLSQNNNLLGGFRYKNERFLRNHLEDEKERQANDPKPAVSGYYLSAEQNQDEEVRQKDEELDVALTIIDRVFSTYGGSMTEGVRRSSHWLALAMPDVKTQIGKYNAAVGQWLKNNFNVVWGDMNPQGDHSLALELSNVPKSPLALGSKIKLNWNLKNLKRGPEQRVSLFAHAQTPGFETVEILVGKMDAGASTAGEMQLRIPAQVESGRLEIRLSAAVDGQPILASAQTLLFDVVERASPDLQANWKFLEETGAVAGCVEINEKVTLAFEVQNNSDAEARNIKMSLVNLAGKQLLLPVDSLDLGLLKARQKKQIKFQISGAAKILSPKLNVGLLIESDDLLTPKRQSIPLVAIPSTGSVSDLLGH